MRLKVLSGLIVVLLVAGCSSNSQDEELRAALDRIEALEDQLLEIATTTTTEPAPPPTTTEPAPQYTRISPSYARRIANLANMALTGREPDWRFEKLVDGWTEQFIMANPGVTDLSPEEFDAWFREKIDEKFWHEIREHEARCRGWAAPDSCKSE